MAFTPYTFTDAQKVDIRRFCGYPAYGDGAVVFPYPWIMKQYLALEYRLEHMSAEEGAVVATYLTTLNTLETDIPGAATNLDTAKAAVWERNPTEVADRMALFDGWRRRLCQFLGIPPGPQMQSGGSNVPLVV